LETAVSTKTPINFYKIIQHHQKIVIFTVTDMSTSNLIVDDKLLVLPTLTYHTHFDNENLKIEAVYASRMLATLPTSTQCKDPRTE
jgi:hypothetical protein